MDIHFVDRSRELTENDREVAERRFLFALSRFGDEIQRVTVVTEDTNGPRGGSGKCCSVSVKLRRRGTVEASYETAEFGPCFSRVADRIARSVARNLELRRRFPRQRIPPATDQA